MSNFWLSICSNIDMIIHSSVLFKFKVCISITNKTFSIWWWKKSLFWMLWTNLVLVSRGLSSALFYNLKYARNKLIWKIIKSKQSHKSVYSFGLELVCNNFLIIFFLLLGVIHKLCSSFFSKFWPHPPVLKCKIRSIQIHLLFN